MAAGVEEGAGQARHGWGRALVVCVAMVAVGFFLGRLHREAGAPRSVTTAVPRGEPGEQSERGGAVPDSVTGAHLMSAVAAEGPANAPGSMKHRGLTVPPRVPPSLGPWASPSSTSAPIFATAGRVPTELLSPVTSPKASAPVSVLAAADDRPAPPADPPAPHPSPAPGALVGIQAGAALGAVDLRYRFRRGERLVYQARLQVKEAHFGGIPMTTVSTGVGAVVEIIQNLENPLAEDRFRVGVMTRVLEPRLPAGDPFGRPHHQELVITDTGRVAERGSGASPSPGPQPPVQREQLQPELAGRPVVVGESWFTESSFPIQGHDVTFRTQYRLETTDALMPGQTNPVAAIRIGYSLVRESPFLDIEIDKDSGGKLWIDAHAGRLLRQTMTLAHKASTRGANGPHRSVGKARIDVDIELLRVERDGDGVPGDRLMTHGPAQHAERLTKR